MVLKSLFIDASFPANLPFGLMGVRFRPCFDDTIDVVSSTNVSFDSLVLAEINKAFLVTIPGVVGIFLSGDVK